MRIESGLLGILTSLALAGSVGAQGLGDAAKREAERRKAAQQKAAPVKSYSDQDLPSSGAAPAAAEEATEEPAQDEVAAAPQGGGAIFGLPTAASGRTLKVKAAASSPGPTTSGSSSSESYGQNPGSEASWRSAASGARRRVATAENRVQELDSKAAGLVIAPSGDCNVGSSARNMTYEDLKKYQCKDPYTEWQGEQKRTLEALDQAKAELEKARKDLEALEESARKQGALPGWLRE